MTSLKTSKTDHPKRFSVLADDTSSSLFTTWHYQWYANGNLQKVYNNDGVNEEYQYDALGRRTAIVKGNTIKRTIYDGNVPLHEFSYALKDKPQLVVDAQGVLSYDKPEPIPLSGEMSEGQRGLITWIFNEGTFVPQAKIVNGETYSIVTDYLGTPTEAYNQEGKKIWSCELDIYGKPLKFTGDKTFIPFRYQGQYDDGDTGLYYNRFRYYSPDSGTYISQDPIGLSGGYGLYAYVHDTNDWIDVFGLAGQRWSGKTKADGTPYRKPGPKTKGTGDHNAKINEIINREKVKPGVDHIGGGSKTEVSIDTFGGNKPTRRMDASFKNADGSVYHINVGRTLEDGKTGIKRERLAIDDVKSKGHNISFEGYGKESDYRPKKPKANLH